LLYSLVLRLFPVSIAAEYARAEQADNYDNNNDPPYPFSTVSTTVSHSFFCHIKIPLSLNMIFDNNAF